MPGRKGIKTETGKVTTKTTKPAKGVPGTSTRGGNLRGGRGRGR